MRPRSSARVGGGAVCGGDPSASVRRLRGAGRRGGRGDARGDRRAAAPSRSAKSASTTTTTFRRRPSSRRCFARRWPSRSNVALPVVIHTREATDDTFAMIGEAGQGRLRGVMHCFSGTVDEARRALDLGFFISLSGIVTFPKAGAVAGRRGVRSRRPPAGRNRCAVSGARAAPRQAQRAGVGGGNDTRSWRRLGGAAPRRRARLVTRNFHALFGPDAR